MACASSETWVHIYMDFYYTQEMGMVKKYFWHKMRKQAKTVILGTEYLKDKALGG